MKHPFLKKFFISTLLVIVTFISSTAIAASVGSIDPTNVGKYKAAFLDTGVVTDPAINFGKFTTESQYNISVSDTELRGYAWGSSVGYIVTNCLDTTSGCSSTNGNFKVANTNGTLSGYAWGENTGWINFGPFTNPGISGVKIDTTSGNFGGTAGTAGYAWSQNYGWIVFDCTNTDTCVNTDWRPTVSGNTGTGPGNGSGPLSGGGSPAQTAQVTPTIPTIPTTPTTPTTPGTSTPPTTPSSTDKNGSNGTSNKGAGIGNGVNPEQPNTSPIGTTPGGSGSGGGSAGPGVRPTGATTQPSNTPPQSHNNGTGASSSVVESISTITSSIGSSFGSIVDVFAPLATGVIGIARTSAGTTASNVATSVGLLLTLLSAIALALATNPFAWADILALPLRLWNLLLIAFGLKRRHHPWGTVYDSVTKQPIDPAYVVLTDLNGNEVATAITDIDGRYGFSVPPGTYKITANKTNFIFPSTKLLGRTADELYDQLYFGDIVVISQEGEVITKNIPMDQQGFDWNEFAKNEQKRLAYFKRRDVTIAHISNFFFGLGFIIAAISLISAHTTYNSIVFIIYLVLFLIRRYIPRFKASGSISDSISDDPLSFAIVRVLSTVTGQEISHKVADRLGNYYCLVPNGKYNIIVDKKNVDGSYTKVAMPYPVVVDKGYLSESFKV